MASYPIQDQIPYAQHVVTGAPFDTFSFSFPIFAAQDISVFKRPLTTAADDNATTPRQLLALTSEYTVTIMGSSGGYITLVEDADIGDVITLVRTMADQRLNQYINTAITADMLNSDFNSDVMMIQQNTMYDTLITPRYNLNAVIDPLVDGYLPILPAYNIWMMNADRTEIVPVNLGGYPITSLLGGTSNHLCRWDTINSIKDSDAVLDDSGNLTGLTSIIVGGMRFKGGVIDTLVTQTAHGFIRENILIADGSGYALATANNVVNAEVTMFVNEVVDANSFYGIRLEGGLITGLTGLVPGTTYFLDASTPGAVTGTEPTTPGQISKPVYNAISTTEAVFINMRGKINPEPAIPGIFWLAVTTNTMMNAYRGYMCNGVGQLEMPLPTTAAVGDTFEVCASGANGFVVKQSTGQQIRTGTSQTSSGAGGTVTSDAQGCWIQIVCDVANTHFMMCVKQGTVSLV